MSEMLLKMQHAAAVRNKDDKEIRRTERELAKLGITAEWLSPDVLLWRPPEKKKRRGRPPKNAK